MTTPLTEDISVDIEGRVQTIRFNRPSKKNALTAIMYARLGEALRAGDRNDEVAAHVLVGSGGVFSAGSDIAEFKARAEGRTDLTEHVLAFIRLLPHVSKPLLAGVDGLAMGIGTTMLFHCDLVYATPASTFRTPFLDLGLVPEAGSSLIAPRMIGPQRAFELLALGDTFDAEWARQAGFVNKIVAAAELEPALHATALRLAAKPPEALALCRRLLRGDPEEVSRRIDEEAAIFMQRLTSPEAREAFAAFIEKRAPDFKRARG